MKIWNRPGAQRAHRHPIRQALLLGGLFISLIQINAGRPSFLFPPEVPISLSQPLRLQWRYQSSQTLNLTPAATRDRLYLPLAQGAIVSLRTDDGGLIWRAEVGGEISAAPVADQRGVFVASETGAPAVSAADSVMRATGSIRALGREAGVTLWARSLYRPLRGGLAETPTHLFGGAADGRVYAFVKETGEIQWANQFASGFTSPAVVAGSRLYLGSEDGSLRALDLATGRAVWHYRTHGPIRGPVAVTTEAVYVGSADGFVYALRADSGKLLWSKRAGAGVQAVGLANGGLIAASLDNFVYFLSPSGDLLWKRQLAGRIFAPPLAAADGILFTPLSADSCVVLNARDGKQVNTLPVGADNNTMASPVVAGNLLLVTTRQGILAFASTTKQGQAPPPNRTRQQLVLTRSSPG
jgi:outer membrane protein assembly factor BamB